MESHRTVLLRRGESERAVRSVLWLTVSKALDRSIDTATVRRGGHRLLKPVTTWYVRGRRAVVVGRNPCYVGEKGRESSSGSSRRSRTLTTGQRREMGRQLGPSPADLPGFGRGMTIAVFQMEGMSEWL